MKFGNYIKVSTLISEEPSMYSQSIASIDVKGTDASTAPIKLLRFETSAMRTIRAAVINTFIM